MVKQFQDLKKKKGRKGYGVEVGLKCLFLQFYYDLSDRQLEERMKDDIAFRWFCGLDLSETTPDHSYFGRIRKILGTNRIGKIFRLINEKARDKAIKEGEEKLNNDNIGKYSNSKGGVYPKK